MRKNWLLFLGVLIIAVAAYAGTINVSDFTSDSAWVEPSLQNGWVNFGGGFANVRYRKDGNTIHLSGSAAPGTLTLDTLIFTLPAGYRPSATIKMTSPTLQTLSLALGHINIESDGSVRWEGPALLVTLAAFDGLSFHL